MLSKEQLFQNWSLSSASSVFTFEEYKRLIGVHQLTGGDDWRKTQEQRHLEQRYRDILAKEKRRQQRLAEAAEARHQKYLEALAVQRVLAEQARKHAEAQKAAQARQREEEARIDALLSEVIAERQIKPKPRYLGEDEIYGSDWDGYPAIDLVQLRHARMGPEAEPEDDNPYQEAARRLYDLEVIAC